MDDQQKRLKKLEEIEYIRPNISWDERKGELLKKLQEFVKVFTANTDNKEIINNLKEMENKLAQGSIPAGKKQNARSKR